MCVFVIHTVIAVDRSRNVSKLVSGFVTGCIVVLVALAVRTNVQRPIAVSNGIPVDKLMQQLLRTNQRKHGSEWKSSVDWFDSKIAGYLQRTIRILCLVYLSPEHDRLQRSAIERTWGNRCTKLLFVSTAAGRDVIVTKLKPLSWTWTVELLRYVGQMHSKKFDWLFMVEANTYVIMENLRYHLHKYSPGHLIHFGHKYKPNVRQGWFCSGAGIVMSRAAIHWFVEAGRRTCQREDSEYGDTALGECMEKLGIVAGDTRDNDGRQRFLCDTLEDQLFPDPDPEDWSNQYEFYPASKGNPMSTNLISFHYVNAKMMYAYDYLIHQLHPHGVIHLPQALEKKLNRDQMLATSRGSPHGGALQESVSHLKHRYQQILIEFPKWTN